MGDLESAKIEFEKVISLSPDYSWAYFNLAVIYHEEGDDDRAIENLRQTIELNPIDKDAYKILAKLLAKKKNLMKQSVLCKTDWQIATNLEICTILQPIFTK